MSALDTQPADRAAAPGELAVVQAFINTSNIEAGTDELGTPAAFRRFLVRHKLPGRRASLTQAHLDRAVELREALRALTAANNAMPLDPKAIEVVNREAQQAGLIAGFAASGGPREIASASGADQAFGELLAIVHRAMRAETWPRLKACREHGCRWSFYDHSRNRSGTWCAMALCGTRSKMRTYRARQDTKQGPRTSRRPGLRRRRA